MNKKKTKDIVFNIIKVMSVIATSIGVIVFLCTVIGGNAWDYNESSKIDLFFPDYKLVVIAIPVFVMLVIVAATDFEKIKSEKKIFVKLKEYLCNEKISAIVILVGLVILYAAWFVVNVKICKKILFSTGGDPSIVQGTAYMLCDGGKIGSDGYYSIYPNNIPMAWLLYRTLWFARKIPGFPYFPEFFWIQILCFLESLTGIALGMTSYFCTKKIGPVLVSTFLFVALVGVSPWNIIPYTEMFTILFPILGLCLYFIYLELKKNIRYFVFSAACLTIAVGSVFKMSVIIVLISILISEILKFFVKKKKDLREFAIILAIIFAVLPLSLGMKGIINHDTGVQRVKNIAASWEHYFYMGLMEETTGAYNAEAYMLIGEYQFRPKSERCLKELSLAGEILAERGPINNVLFCIKKLVMTFNDGTFSWRGEGGMQAAFYPDITSETFREELRSFYWNEGEKAIGFNTYSQGMWILVLFGFLVSAVWFTVSLFKNKKFELKSFTALLSIVGTVLCITLFEARARYLYPFIPIFILMCSIGAFNLRVILKESDEEE